MKAGHLLEYSLLLGVSFLFRWLPIDLSRALGRAVGRLGGRVLKIRKKVAFANIQQAFPEWTSDEVERCYQKMWEHFGMVAAELSRLPRMSVEDLEKHIDHDIYDYVKGIFSRGKGAIFVSGHIGNWEWLGALIAARGFPFTFIVEQQSNRLVERWMDRMRTRPGVDIYSRANAAKGTLQALKNNRLVAILSDQDAGKAGVFVPFFGKLASTPRGPALFHLRTGATLLYGSCCRENGKFHLKLEEIVIQEPTGNRERDETEIMTAITSRLESDIRQHPEQYMWLHRRWKTSPEN